MYLGEIDDVKRISYKADTSLLFKSKNPATDDLKIEITFLSSADINRLKALAKGKNKKSLDPLISENVRWPIFVVIFILFVSIITILIQTSTLKW